MQMAAGMAARTAAVAATATRALAVAARPGVRALTALLLAAMAAAPQALAGEGQSARDIIDRMEQLYRGKSSQADITMIVETPQYQRTLKINGQSLGRQLGLFRILAPKKDRGIATLKRDTEMWNYFPKISKVIKVPPSMMMGSWMGSDFTNDDLVKDSQLADDYHLSLAETATEYQITLTPRADTVTLWGRIDYAVAKSPLLPVSQVFYDDRGEKVRVMTFSEPKTFDGRLMPSVLEMQPLAKPGHRTRVIYERIVFDPPDITDASFSMRNLKARF